MLFLTAVCNTHIYCHNYDNYVVHYTTCMQQKAFSFVRLSDALLSLVKNSFLAHFVSRTICMVSGHMQEHIFLTFPFFPDFSLTTLKFRLFQVCQVFQVSGHSELNDTPTP